MKKQITIITTILGLVLMMTLVSAVTYGSVEQDIEFKSNEVTTSPEDSSSSGSSSAAPKDWSAKCGYNKECLYGKTETISNETVEIEEEQEETEEVINDPVIEEKTSTGKIVMTGIFIVVAVILMSLLGKKLSKKDIPEIETKEELKGDEDATE